MQNLKISTAYNMHICDKIMMKGRRKLNIKFRLTTTATREAEEGTPEGTQVIP